MRCTHYGILGIRADASVAEVKRAYREKILRCHPDKCIGDAKEDDTAEDESFQRIQEAWKVLSHKNSREAYDALLYTEYRFHQKIDYVALFPGTADDPKSKAQTTDEKSFANLVTKPQTMLEHLKTWMLGRGDGDTVSQGQESIRDLPSSEREDLIIDEILCQRCGDVFEITFSELESGVRQFQCSGCSSYLHVKD